MEAAPVFLPGERDSARGLSLTLLVPYMSLTLLVPFILEGLFALFKDAEGRDLLLGVAACGRGLEGLKYLICSLPLTA